MLFNKDFKQVETFNQSYKTIEKDFTLVKTFCPSCNSFYKDFISNVNVTHYFEGGKSVKFYYSKCYDCLVDEQLAQEWLIWQSLIFKPSDKRINLSPLNI